MKSLTEYNSIEDWMQLADCIQQIEFRDYNKGTFLQNLFALRKVLVNMDGNLDTIRDDSLKLLQSIYDGQVGIHKKRSTFYETIYALNDLGVKNIAFNKRNTDSFDSLKAHTNELSDRDFFYKVYTDGSFIADTYYEYVSKVQDETYIMDLKIDRNSSILSSNISLVRFDIVDKLPTKEEIIRFSAPKIKNANTDVRDWTSLPRVFEVFDNFDLENSSFAKRLEISNEFYYKSK